MSNTIVYTTYFRTKAAHTEARKGLLSQFDTTRLPPNIVSLAEIVDSRTATWSFIKEGKGLSSFLRIGDENYHNTPPSRTSRGETCTMALIFHGIGDWKIHILSNETEEKT